MKRTLLTLLCLALLAAACGGSSDEATTTTSGPTTPPADGTDVLLMINDEGGFVPIEFTLNNPPTYVLLNNGTLIFLGVQPGAFPGPLMPSMVQTQLTADQMDDIRVLIAAAGLPDVDDFVNNDANNFVADASTTVATYWDADGMTHKMSVYALGLTLEGDVPDELANLLLLRTTLSDFTFEGASDTGYTSDKVILRVLEGGGFAEFNDTRPWEFSVEPADLPQLNGFPCIVLDGAEAAAVRALLSDATQATQWEHETGQFTVLARDLLPGETGCDPQ